MSTEYDELHEAITASDDYIDNWDEYWLALAVAVSRKSKDPKCRVGAVIVRDNLQLSTGFNGFAREVFDSPVLLADPGEKLKWICHAEQNAIHNAARLGVALADATIYVTKFPCLACCNAIVQAGIREIYTQDSKYWDDDPADGDHSRKKSILRQVGVKVVAPFHVDFKAKLVGPGKGLGTRSRKSKQKRARTEMTSRASRKKGLAKAGPEPMKLFPEQQASARGKGS